MWYTCLINIHSTETTEQQHMIRKQEDCPDPRRIVSQKIVTTCSHYPLQLSGGSTQEAYVRWKERDEGTVDRIG